MLIVGGKLYGVYWTSGISSSLLGIYYETDGDILNQFARDNNAMDFSDYIAEIIESQNGAELDECKTNEEYQALYDELFENEAACYSVEPVEISLQH